MPRRTKLVPATDEDLRARRTGLRVRLLICNRCSSVWPTERDPAHGGSRQDGEPCAYRWADGRVCMGTVHPEARQRSHRQRAFDDFWPEPPERAAYSGGWCKVLGLDWGTTDLAKVRRAYRELALKRHPDRGGSEADMKELNLAYAQALAELGQR